MDVRPPNRVIRSYAQHLHAPPQRVFPLLCPVREADWIDGWDPRLVISASGAAERDCVFVTPGAPQDAIWVVTRHEPQDFVEMLKVTPGLTVCRLSIALHAAGAGCDAVVTYAYTSLGPAGDALVDGFTDAHYARFMQDWEARLNHFLATGTRLPAKAP